MKSRLRRRRHTETPVDLDEENVVTRLTRDVTVTSEGGLPGPSNLSHRSDDNLCSQHGNDWIARYDSLYFGHREFGRISGKWVHRVSDMPFSDIVLTKDGNEMLTSNAINLIKRLSSTFVDAGKIHVHDGPFGCIWPYPRGRERAIIAGDRPFPYFYSHSAPDLRGRLFHTIRTSVRGRMIKFVKIGDVGLVTPELRGEVLYLVPNDGDWCAEVFTRFLPLDWQPSCDLSSGNGKNLQILLGSFETTARKRSFEEDRRISRGPLILSTVLEVCDGVVESLSVDEDLYHPKVVKKVNEAAGKRVLVYRPLTEVEDQYRISHKVLKRVKRYDQLVQKIGGSWPKTTDGIQSCLSVSMTELIVAGIYHPDVRQRFLGLFCFLENPFGCVHNTSEILLESESDDGSAPGADKNEKDARNTGYVVGEKDGISVAFVMNHFYKYSPVTRSYYTINRPVDKPVVVTSDGEVIHFTESEVPVAVLSTPFGNVVCGRMVSNDDK